MKHGRISPTATPAVLKTSRSVQFAQPIALIGTNDVQRREEFRHNHRVGARIPVLDLDRYAPALGEGACAEEPFRSTL